MPRITSVESQKRNPHRFNIFLDGKFAFGADEDLVVDKRLIVGKEVLPEDLDGLLEEAQIGKLMERMYGLLGRRQRSEKEIRDYLKQLSFRRKVKGEEDISDLVVERLIEKLKQKRLLNDLDFAKVWVESRSKKKGINALKSELFQKGIDREIIEEAIGSGFMVHSQEITAKTLLEKRINRWKNLPKVEFRQKAFQFLMRQGFDYSIAKDVIDFYLKKD